MKLEFQDVLQMRANILLEPPGVIATVGHKANTLLIDLKLPLPVELVQSLNLSGCFRSGGYLNTAGKGVGPQDVTTVAQRLTNHPRKTVVPRGSPNCGSSLIKF